MRQHIIAVSVSFNGTNIDAFSDDLKEVSHSLQAGLDDVWNTEGL